MGQRNTPPASISPFFMIRTPRNRLRTPGQWKFKKASEEPGIRAEFVGRADIGRLRQFDELFFRGTTFLNHCTYRLSRLGSAEGLIVIDDPTAILQVQQRRLSR